MFVKKYAPKDYLLRAECAYGMFGAGGYVPENRVYPKFQANVTLKERRVRLKGLGPDVRMHDGQPRPFSRTRRSFRVTFAWNLGYTQRIRKLAPKKATMV